MSLALKSIDCTEIIPRNPFYDQYSISRRFSTSINLLLLGFLFWDCVRGRLLPLWNESIFEHSYFAHTWSKSMIKSYLHCFNLVRSFSAFKSKHLTHRWKQSYKSKTQKVRICIVRSLKLWTRIKQLTSYFCQMLLSV